MKILSGEIVAFKKLEDAILKKDVDFIDNLLNYQYNMFEVKKNLEESSVKEIDCLNNPFNPEEMEAVMTEVVEGVNPNIVTDVLLKGYKYNDKVIRPAMVKVSE